MATDEQTRKFIAEHNELMREKSLQEALEFQSRQFWLVPLALVVSWLLAALIGAGVALLF